MIFFDLNDYKKWARKQNLKNGKPCLRIYLGTDHYKILVKENETETPKQNFQEMLTKLNHSNAGKIGMEKRLNGEIKLVAT